jgi:hypothetical protein
MQPTDRTHGSRLTIAFVAFFAVLAVLLRVAPRYHDLGQGVWNMMPIGALALFAGSRLRGRAAWLVPLATMLAADLLLIYPLAKMGMASFSLIRTPIIYLSFLAYVGLGRLVRAGELSPPVVGGAALLGSVQFFVLTNFASWLYTISSPPPPPEYVEFYYQADLSGLATCFLKAVPFYKHTLASDLIFAAVIFGGHAALSWALAERPAAAASAKTTWQAVAAWAPPRDEQAIARRDEVSR